MNFVYKLERNRHRSQFYVIRQFLPNKQLDTFHIGDLNLGVV